MDQLEEALTDDTQYLLMFVNNEVGTVEPIYDIENIVSNSNALLHVDAVQAISHLDIKFSEFNIDTMSITAHKFGGPKGVGILLVKQYTNRVFSIRRGTRN